VYNILYQFLILNKQLGLPGMGTIHLQKKSSELDFANKIFTSPTYIFKIEQGKDVPSKKLFAWLSKVLNVTEAEAVRLLNNFSFELKNELSVSGEANWQHVGIFRRDDKGDIILHSSDLQLECEMPVMAEKVIREKAEHTVLVGEMEKSAAEMEILLGESEVKKDHMWKIAITLLIMAFLFVGYYLSEKGFHPSSFGNQSVLIPK
jgi:transcriptional regulator with XRE-family HTH domain